MKEYVGTVVLELDSREVEVASVSVRTSTGRKPVKVMTRLRRIPGFVRGIETHELRIAAVIPKGEKVDWAGIEQAKLTIDPDNGDPRTSYLDCFATEVGEEYKVDDEARVDVTLMAARKVTE